MSVKKINIIYLYPLKFENGKSKCFNLSPILKGLKALPVDERVLDLGKEENVQ